MKHCLYNELDLIFADYSNIGIRLNLSSAATPGMPDGVAPHPGA